MRTIEIGSFEAKNKLSALLVAVEQGQRVMITRRGRRVAMLTAPEDDATTGKALSAAEVLKGFRTVRSTAKKGGGSLKTLIDEGRRR